MLVQGLPALMTNHSAVCPLGMGQITIKDSGQGGAKRANPPLTFEAVYQTGGSPESSGGNSGSSGNNNSENSGNAANSGASANGLSLSSVVGAVVVGGSAVANSTTSSTTSAVSSRGNPVQHSAVESLKGNIATSTNQRKGNFGEMATDVDVETKGPIDPDTNMPDPNTTATRVGTGRVEDVDAPLQQGIDAIYKCDPPPPDYLIVESKYGKSQLSKKPKDGPQMSDKWIDGSARIDRYFGTNEDGTMTQEHKDFMEAWALGDVQKEVSRIDASGNVVRKILKD